jgi:hypothetical protein
MTSDILNVEGLPETWVGLNIYKNSGFLFHVIEKWFDIIYFFYLSSPVTGHQAT